mgnify:CR=1 FL=1
MSTLQQRIKQRMAAKGLTNAQLAAACRVKPPTSFNWASGKTKNIKGEPLLLAAKALGVTPEWLATGLGTMTPESGTAATSHHIVAAEPTVTYLPEKRADALTVELLELFSSLDEASKREWLSNLRGFVAGRRPHSHGATPALAGK